MGLALDFDRGLVPSPSIFRTRAARPALGRP
jgi:hypothetical protein